MPRCEVGVGLRPVHYPHLLTRPKTSVRWFEAISENYMDSEGRPLEMLKAVRRDYPLALHGVSLSIGSVEGPRPGYLERLKRLISRVEPFLVSDHLCWTGAHASNTHDLLPLPYTRETLEMVVERIGRVQEFLGRPISMENVSSYLRFEQSAYSERDFITETARRSGCKILLDLNNVYVNAKNHGFDAAGFVEAVPPELVSQIHLAGFTDMGTHLFDTHSKPVSRDVWDLYALAARRMPEVPVLIEWDEDIPPFAELEKQALKAADVWRQNSGHDSAGRPAKRNHPVAHR